MHRRLSILLLVTAMAVFPSAARVELYLADGQVVVGDDIELKEGNYLVEDDQGRIVAIPAALVARLAFIGEPEPEPEGSADEVAAADPSDDEAPDKPEGPYSHDGPRVLAGAEIVPPRSSEQLKVLGDSARFARDIVDPRWRPQNSWTESGSIDFAPSTWPRNLVDSAWTPSSGFPANDVGTSRQTRWQRGVIDSTWVPVDGFRGGF